MKIGFSANEECLKNEEFYRKCQDAGLSCLEISLPGRNIEAFDFEKAAKLADKYSLELWTVHLSFAPFSEIDISSEDEKMRSFTVSRHTEVIQRASEAGIRHFVIHASGEPVGVEERRSRMSQAKKSLSELAEAAAEYGGTICVEDLPRTCLGRSSYDILELLKADDRLRCCFDTNHLLGEYIPDFIRKVGNKIVTTHISDYDFWNERHMMPGEGQINWKELYDTLISVGYQGPWIYETGLTAPWCVIRDRDLTACDLVQNAREIFSGKAPTPIGHMIENITFWKEE